MSSLGEFSRGNGRSCDRPELKTKGRLRHLFSFVFRTGMVLNPALRVRADREIPHRVGMRMNTLDTTERRGDNRMPTALSSARCKRRDLQATASGAVDLQAAALPRKGADTLRGCVKLGVPVFLGATSCVSRRGSERRTPSVPQDRLFF